MRSVLIKSTFFLRSYQLSIKKYCFTSNTPAFHFRSVSFFYLNDMKRLLKGTVALVVALCLLQACDESCSCGEVALYPVTSYERTGMDSCAIVASSVMVRDIPLIPYEDLTYYDAGEHVFGLSSAGVDSLLSLNAPVSGIPFAILAGEALIYTGYFWPSTSSASCQWVVIDPLFAEMDQRMQVRLGYPGQQEGADIPDHRNDPRILDVFRKDGKLRE
jgi:hypothetical protein